LSAIVIFCLRKNYLSIFVLPKAQKLAFMKISIFPDKNSRRARKISDSVKYFLKRQISK